MEYWFIRIFDYPRLQILIGGVIITALFLFVFERKKVDIIFLTIILLVVISQAYLIFPFTSIAPVEVLSADEEFEDSSISILVSNVLMTNRGSSELLSIIHDYDPDIVLLTEPDNWWADNLNELDSIYSYSLKVPLPNTYGMFFYSNLKLYQPEIRYLVQKDIPSVHAYIQLKSGAVIEFFGLHPRPPFPPENYESDERDAELLIAGREAAKSKYAVILAGDFNDVAWSSTTELFKSISETVDPRIGRGLYNTFNAELFFLRWPLDHIFHSEQFLLKDLLRVDRHYGSDHFPIYIELALEPKAKVFQEAPKVSAEEKETAEDKIEEALEENN